MSKVLATRFANVPALANDERAEWFGECLSAASVEVGKIQAREQAAPARMQDDFWPEEDDWLAEFRPYTVMNGTLVLPIKGVLLHDFGYQIWDWATGYTYIRRAYERGMNDPAVQRIALMINSGGGEVAGNFDLVDAMYARRGEKPVQAFVNEHAYSAAFSLASVAEKIVMPRTGGVGSVGVVTAHADFSGAMEKMGIKVTFIHAGKLKVEGNRYEPLSEEAKNRMQARIDGLYDIFAATVARNLQIDESAVRATEAGTFDADGALAIGFAHEVRPIDEALAAFAIGRTSTKGEVTMSQENENASDKAFTQADLDAARAEGRKEGATAERERIQGIMGCDEAKSRADLSFHLSMNTELSVESAKAILAASPEQAAKKPEKEEASHGRSDFEAAMSQNNPNVGGEEANDEGNGNQDALATILADYQAATGYKKERK